MSVEMISPILRVSEGLDTKVNHHTGVTKEKDGCSTELQILQLVLLTIIIYEIRFI
jgi:hypothetical protein